MILVTNDDGVRAQGLLALKQALSEIADVVVLAPERNWSASAHAKTMHKPLRIAQTTLADGSVANVSTGSPADCVALAAGGVLGVQPDLVVSGINSGHNLGVDVTYSGTVACAMEATISGIPGIAVSSIKYEHDDTVKSEEVHAVLAAAAEVACQIAELVLTHGLPEQTLLNVNVPGLAREDIRGIHVTRMGGRKYDNSGLVARHDPAGRPYFWLGGSGPIDVPDDGSDVGAVQNGYVSVTPISLDMTDTSFMEDLYGWGFAVPASANGTGR